MNNHLPSTKRRLFQNWLSWMGAVIAIGALFAFVLLFAIDLLAHGGNPYMGILAYVVAPGFLVVGLFLVLLGGWLSYRHWQKAEPSTAPHVLKIDFGRPRDRQLLFWFVMGTMAFLLLTSLGSYKTYHYSESVQFCGLACHTPMKPEYTAYLNSSHARVECVECHVGSGADAYVKAKLNGVHQLLGVIKGDYQRPIKTPVRNLRPAQETCEQCHWPQKFDGNLDRTYAHFLNDETNTPFTVRLLLKVGGGDAQHGPPGGIHWHMNIANKIEYVATDEKRQVIPWVRMTDSTGKVTEFHTADFTNETSKSTVRTMDCMDCHNRPAHQFRAPNDSVDLAMSLGKINTMLPWIKSNAVTALTGAYTNESEALTKISVALRTQYPAYSKLDSLVSTVQGIYTNNFFPEMKANWSVYPDNIGHKNWNGCFRCHDGKHKSNNPQIKMIAATDCNSCHTILAQGSGSDLDKLSPKGHTFFHIDAPNEDFSCAECHNGALTKE
jgi:nitrate/TMAO reductase-like tetraheme cytochrome c subunit